MRRSKLEIYVEVLHTINEGITKPTRIMYGVNTSWKYIQEILNSMVTQDLISKIDLTSRNRKQDKRTNTVYEITPRGQNVIKYFNQANGLIKIRKQSPIRTYAF